MPASLRIFGANSLLRNASRLYLRLSSARPGIKGRQLTVHLSQRWLRLVRHPNCTTISVEHSRKRKVDERLLQKVRDKVCLGRVMKSSKRELELVGELRSL